MIERFPEIQKLSREELMSLAQDIELLLHSIVPNAERDHAIVELLKKRYQEYLADPSTGMTLEEFRERFRQHIEAHRQARKDWTSN